jgi:thioredoxin-dependent peroxiredoxin
MEICKAKSPAPFFEGADQSGKTVNLNTFRGKRLILYFYPKDDTPGCTAEACNLRDNLNVLHAKGFEIVGVSADNEKSHNNFASKNNLSFSLIADTDKKIINDYGVWGEKNMYGKIVYGIKRTTFIINEEGIIEKVISKVDTKNHAAQILKELD